MLRAQIRTLTSTRQFWVYMILVAGGIALSGLLISMLWQVDKPLPLEMAFMSSSLATVLMIVGIPAILGSEISRGMIGAQFTSTNQRSTVILTQIILAWLSFFVAAVVGVLITIAVFSLIGTGYNWNALSDSATRQTIGKSLLEWVVFPLIAGGLTWLIRSGSISSIILIADYLIIEQLLSVIPNKVAQQIASILPVANINIVTQTPSYAIADHSPTVAALILVALIVVFIGAGMVTGSRRAVR